MISLGVIKRLSLRLQVFGKNPSTPASIEIRDFVYGSQYGFPVNMTWVNSEKVDFHTSFMISLASSATNLDLPLVWTKVFLLFYFQ